jgi:hypothetical protein
MANITLTEKQIRALLFAIDITELNYEGWTVAELKDSDVHSDLQILKRVTDKLNNAGK